MRFHIHFSNQSSTNEVIEEADKKKRNQKEKESQIPGFQQSTAEYKHKVLTTYPLCDSMYAQLHAQ